MARIFEQPRDGSVAIRPSAGGSAFDRATGGALAAFWLSIGAIGIAGIAFAWYARSANLDSPRILAAYAVALLAIVALFLLRRSLMSMHFESKSKAGADAMVADYLDQLDDRFSVFRDVCAGEVWADHFVMGPSGFFAMQTATRVEKGMIPAHRDLDRAAAARIAMENLLRQLVPMAAPRVEAVLVLADSSGHDVARDPDGVWLVPADKIVAALLKRSSQSGAITRGVMDTGAFASESLQNAALEEALATHLKAQMRSTLKHYAASAEMTKGSAPPPEIRV